MPGSLPDMGGELSNKTFRVFGIFEPRFLGGFSTWTRPDIGAGDTGSSQAQTGEKAQVRHGFKRLSESFTGGDRRGTQRALDDYCREELCALPNATQPCGVASRLRYSWRVAQASLAPAHSLKRPKRMPLRLKLCSLAHQDNGRIRIQRCEKPAAHHRRR